MLIVPRFLLTQMTAQYWTKMRATPLFLLLPKNGSILNAQKQTSKPYITTWTSFSRNLQSKRGAKRTLPIHVRRSKQRDVSFSLRNYCQLFAKIRFVQEGLRHGEWKAPDKSTMEYPLRMYPSSVCKQDALSSSIHDKTRWFEGWMVAVKTRIPCS